MFSRVLVPVDFSEHSKKTLQCLTRIPGIKDVILQHIVDATLYTKRGWTHEPRIENANIRLAEEKKFLEQLGFTVSISVTVITSGEISSAIINTATKEKVTCIIMGSRGRGMIKGLLLGSVSSDVLRNGKIPLLIIHHDLAGKLEGKIFDKFCPNILSRVLCPIDFSELSLNALSCLKDINGGGELHVLHVITKGETHDEIMSTMKETEKTLDALRADLKRRGLDVKTHVRLGRPVDEIITFAEDHDVSLICISSHGKGFLTELVIGSTTLGVAIHTKRPVMVIHPTVKE